MCFGLVKKHKIVVKSVFAGIVITLVTGFLFNKALLGATYYGYILPWMFRPVVAPEYATTQIIWGNLIIDIIFWSVVAFIVCKLLCKEAKPKKPKKRSRRR